LLGASKRTKRSPAICLTRAVRDVAKASRNVERAEEDLAEAIAVARAEGHSDQSIRVVIAASRRRPASG
jgi:hypothetical protein